MQKALIFAVANQPNIKKMQTKGTSELVSPTSFRIDKYLVNDISGFNNQIESDDRLVRNIIYSVAEDYEHSLFGFGTLDPARFAERWNYDPSYLRRRVDSPAQLTDLPADAVEAYRARIAGGKGDREAIGSDQYVWDTRLENALYILSHKPFSFNTYGEFSIVNPETRQERAFKTHASFTLFSAISAVYAKRGKVIYTYTLNENFEKNLTRYYIRGERETLLALRGSGLDTLYLALANLRVNLGLRGKGKTDVEYGPTFDELCEMAHVPKSTKEGKPYELRERKRLLTNAFKRVMSATSKSGDLECTVTFVRAGKAGEDPVPVIDFGTDHIQRCASDKPGYGSLVASMERTLIQRQLIQRELLSLYKRLFSGGAYVVLDEGEFNRWAMDVHRDRLEKETALRLAYIGIFGRIPENAESLNRTVFDMISDCRTGNLSDALRRLSLAG